MILKDFQYSSNTDQKVFCSGNEKIGDKKFTIQACTLSGSRDGKTRKPNEDSFSIVKDEDSIIACVFDGASSQKPIHSLGDISGARFASHFLKDEFEKGNNGKTPKQIMRSLNKKLREKVLKFEGTSLSDVHTLPTSTATIVQIYPEKDLVNISHVGDSFCIILFQNGSTQFVTIDRNKRYDDEILNEVKRISVEQGITPLEAKKDERIRKAIADMFQESFNKSDGTGQGVINGHPAVEQYIQDLLIPLSDIKAILLGTDGLIPPNWDEQKTADQNRMFKVILKDGLEKLITIKTDTEDADPNLYLPRYKHSDDATGIFIDFSY